MNILLLTNLYPHNDDANPDITKVCAYFAREWVKQGHKVVTIVNSSAFPKVYYTVGKYAKKFISGHYGISTAPNSMWSNFFEFEDLGVKVINMPMVKFVPRGKFFKSTFENQVKRIIDILNNNDFVPDVITGHWANPQIRLVADLAKHYNVKSALVLHSDHSKELCERYKVNDYMDKIDRFGFRSKTAAEKSKNYLDFKSEPFVCYSGVPEHFLSYCIDINNKCFDSSKIKIITASRLITCKHIDSVISAVNNVLKGIDFEYIIAGDGPLMESLQKQAADSCVCDKITFLGQIDRNELQKKMSESTVYVMISQETFGLVYIEAMLQGCIVVASRYGGIDGVIVDGENGFLCEEGNSSELGEILKRIINLSPQEKKRIAVNAIETAKKFSEPETARRYLEDILR
ncbi:MAG: glycosyltransferase [Clostridia bacterium]|nr:glycosyltransferase [Clostridia bacterium]MBQ4338231.1 glycosyltransferase [Clostridia bacterium]